MSSAASFARAIAGERARARRADEAAYEFVRRCDAALTKQQLQEVFQWAKGTPLQPLSLYRSSHAQQALDENLERLVARGLIAAVSKESRP